MAFVRQSGLRADYVTDEPMSTARKWLWYHAMLDWNDPVRDELWYSLYGVVMENRVRSRCEVRKVSCIFLMFYVARDRV